MRFLNFFCFFVFVLFFCLHVLALVENQQLKVLAVTNDGKGLAADLFLEVESGNGRVWVAAQPLVGTTTQSAAQIAVDLAKNYSGEVKRHDFKFSIESSASVVEGPSAGAAMALLVISAFEDKKVPLNVSITGTINSDGLVGQVGGVFEKSKEAARNGIKLFMIPKGEANQTIRENGTVQSINLVEYGPSQLGMKIIEVSSIDEVLKFAFVDIDTIDVSQIIAQSEVPEFVPKSIEVKAHLSAMKALVTNYIEETRILVQEARNAVSSTLINDPEIVNTLLEVINVSDQLLKDADILNTQNYLYSAANFAFLARVDALLVKDVSTNPSLLSIDSTILNIKIKELKTEIDSFEENLSGNISVDALEWHVSAQQRLVYAKLNIEKISSTQTIIVGESNDFDIALTRLNEYEFAVAWLDVAKDFFALTGNAKKFAKPDSKLKPVAEKLISEAENTISVLTQLQGQEDIERRLNAAKYENLQEWDIASAVDAATASALAQSEQSVLNKSADELSEILASKISSLEAKIFSSKHVFFWPILYLDHSKYFLEASKYYSSSGSTSRSINALRSGVSLITLAEQIFDPLEQAYIHFDSVQTTSSNGKIFFPASQQNQQNGQVKVFSSNNLSSFLPAFFVLGIVLAGFVFLFFTLKMLSGPAAFKPFNSSKQIQKIKNMKMRADEALFKGVISNEKHSQLVKDYEQELLKLEKNNDHKTEQLMPKTKTFQNNAIVTKKASKKTTAKKKPAKQQKKQAKKMPQAINEKQET